MADDALLQVRGLVKQFGALRASDAIELTVHTGEIHALIGPNGAGKTTLVAQLSGHLQPDQGRILMAGQDITRRPAHERVRLGLARSFQITRLFKSFSVQHNLALAVQARSGHSFAFWRAVDDEADLTREAQALAEQIGLSDRLGQAASALSHGEQRILELGLAVATRPRLLLLDEPMAGAGPTESQRILALIQQLRADMAILLIEHDMDAVFTLADRISVLVNGAVIASDLPDAIRQDPQVIAAYLGEEHL